MRSQQISALFTAARDQEGPDSLAPLIAGPVQRRPENEAAHECGIASDAQHLPERRDRQCWLAPESADVRVDLGERGILRRTDFRPEDDFLAVPVAFDEHDALAVWVFVDATPGERDV